ncbi:methyltransferase domain-containing protein [Methanoregula sp.]|uniref:bifunctional cobalt-precorrin-7 (C(5))-methyltransferase/cobalt-precorrin-6B (C(15))-methyltransferase n=1 Tax=Methanoregula sp. TaxID=2052170 RepID=UPI000CB603CE|nr:methyltransferase domain-containing protein [Methanoregula sp.]PKG31339.1 MAG: cobalt-precorrin-6Y C(15)-methyltransferase [Methanoregula sp.]
MPGTKLPGGPTQDEVMAVSLQKLGLVSTDTVLEIGCGTGKVSVAMAQAVQKVISIDIRPEAVALATKTAKEAGRKNIEFSCAEATEFLRHDAVYDCAFLGGTKNLLAVLPVLAKNVKRTIVVNAVLLSTVADAVAALQELGLFVEVVQVQVSRSHAIVGSIMFKPIDPVFVIVGRGAACS